MFKTIRELIEMQKKLDADIKALRNEKTAFTKKVNECKELLLLNQKTDHILVLSDDDSLELLRKMKDKYDWDIELYDRSGNKIVIRNNKTNYTKSDIFTMIGDKE